MIDIKEISKKCPKSYELLRKYIERGLIEMQKRLSDNVGSVKMPELPTVDNRIVEGTLVWNQRTLFDFFDENNIYISIKCCDPWQWGVFDGGEYNEEEFFSADNRIECEEKAFSMAFDKLENKS